MCSCCVDTTHCYSSLNPSPLFSVRILPAISAGEERILPACNQYWGRVDTASNPCRILPAISAGEEWILPAISAGEEWAGSGTTVIPDVYTRSCCVFPVGPPACRAGLATELPDPHWLVEQNDTMEGNLMVPSE